MDINGNLKRRSHYHVQNVKDTIGAKNEKFNYDNSTHRFGIWIEKATKMKKIKPGITRPISIIFIGIFSLIAGIILLAFIKEMIREWAMVSTLNMTFTLPYLIVEIVSITMIVLLLKSLKVK